MLSHRAQNVLNSMVGGDGEDKFKREEFIEYQPDSSDINFPNTDVVLRLPRLDSYVNLSKAYYYIKGQIVKSDTNLDYAVADKIRPVNNFISFHFDKFSCTVNGSEIAYLQNLGRAT